MPAVVGAQPAATPPAASGPSACRSWHQADPWAHMQQQTWPHKRRQRALGCSGRGGGGTKEVELPHPRRSVVTACWNTVNLLIWALGALGHAMTQTC